MLTNSHEPVILVIEGDQSRRNVVCEALHRAGFAVVAASTGAQALATVESRRVSLVLAGSHLRGLSGAEVLLKLRDREARHQLSPVPFMMLPDDLDLSAGTRVRCLAWPVTVGELVSTVSEMLNRQRALQPLP